MFQRLREASISVQKKMWVIVRALLGVYPIKLCITMSVAGAMTPATTLLSL